MSQTWPVKKLGEVVDANIGMVDPKEYPELDQLMIKLENPSKESVQEVVTNIFYGYDQGWLQLSQLLGVVEDIPFDVAGKIQGVLIEQRSKIRILSDKTLLFAKSLTFLFTLRL